MAKVKSSDQPYGARPLKRFVQRQIETPLARMMIKEGFPEIERFKVNLILDNNLTFNVEKIHKLNQECDD